MVEDVIIHAAYFPKTIYVHASDLRPCIIEVYWIVLFKECVPFLNRLYDITLFVAAYA